MVSKKRIGEILIEDFRLITPSQLNEALEKQQGVDKKIGEILVEDKVITPQQLGEALQYQLGIPYVDLSTYRIDRNASQLVPEGLARRHNVLPVGMEDNKIVLVMDDPMDIIAIDDIRMTTSYDTRILMSSRDSIRKAISNIYVQSEAASRAIQELSRNDQENETRQAVESAEVSNAPVVRLVNQVISGAIKSRTSDIHIEAFERGGKVRYRIDGKLREVMTIPKGSHTAIVARVKIMGGMDIAEHRIPQDGRVETVVEGKAVDLRISILPTVFGEKVVIRILDRSSILMTRSQLGFTEHNMKLFDRIIKAPEGIILITGPTGSGKSTTLYACLNEMNDPGSNIITVEDPVEYRLEGINQVQVNTKAGLTFAGGLRSILRQDPDIVMVGEIRDAETAEIATKAAITGHTVLSTLHTNDTVSTVFRLIDMGIEMFMVSTALVGVIAQRLVRRICNQCKERVMPTVEEMMILRLDKPIFLYRGRGCNLCNGTGYFGRIAIHEILVIDRPIRTIISKNGDASTIKDAAVSAGMKTLHDSAKELVLTGVTTVEEMLKVTYSVDD
ncbi:MAG: GspE/PulE family protein [Clostridiales bacterium]|jgi:type IV pilus assembly protein PilB|nr:GspE/PulE family protein [Clostridiales bacterium]